MHRYTNLFTDFAFKRIFGSMGQKSLLMAFVNALFAASSHQVRDIRYLNVEKMGTTAQNRRAYFDIYFEDTEGSVYIVELQRSWQQHLKSRANYYISHAIHEQAKSGKWDFYLPRIYFIAILNFSFPGPPTKLPLHHVQDWENFSVQPFDDQIFKIFLEVPKFQKSLVELATDLDRWIYVFKNLHQLKERPPQFNRSPFIELFERSELIAMSPQEQETYQYSLKQLRDHYASMTSARMKGREEGKIEGRIEGRIEGVGEGTLRVAARMIHLELDDKLIQASTGLALATIQTLRDFLKQGGHLDDFPFSE